MNYFVSSLYYPSEEDQLGLLEMLNSPFCTRKCYGVQSSELHAFNQQLGTQRDKWARVPHKIVSVSVEVVP